MNEEIPQQARRLFTLGWWLAVAAVIAVALFFLFPAILVDGEGIYQIDAETQAIQAGLAQYKTEFGAFPSGDSRAICRALTGDNPKSIRFIELHSVTPDGDFLDPWGTPYKIYYSGDWPLVRSAGPNKQFDPSRMRKRTDDYFGG